MNLRGRIGSLEREVAARGDDPDDAADDDLERTDEEEADRVGDHHFAGTAADLDRHADQSPEWREQFLCPHDPLLREWYAAVAEARDQGHAAYHVGMRPLAMRLWLDMKSSILEHRRTHGRWVWLDPPTRLETMLEMEPDKYRTLPPQEMVNLYMEMNRRRGYWSKLGPESVAKRR